MHPDKHNVVVIQSPQQRSREEGGLLAWMGLSGITGWLGGSIYANTIGKMLEFNREVATRTREDISKMGLGAGMGSIGSLDGASRGIIEEKHALDLIEDPKFKFAKFNRIIGGSFSLLVGTVTAVLGGVAYFASRRQRQSEASAPEFAPREHVRHIVNAELADGKKWAETVQQDRKTEPSVSP
ncbi:MAG: hypothetical protein ACK5VT_03280 [Alphaproteobacteria bacterium]|jgi:hypothetical protein